MNHEYPFDRFGRDWWLEPPDDYDDEDEREFNREQQREIAEELRWEEERGQ